MGTLRHAARMGILPCTVVLLLGLSLAAVARAQVTTGCYNQTVTNDLLCWEIRGGCTQIIHEVAPIPDLGGYYSYQTSTENLCCGDPVLVYQSSGYCGPYRPESQSYGGNAAPGPATHAAPLTWPLPERSTQTSWRVQPVYLRDCSGGYDLYIAPST